MPDSNTYSSKRSTSQAYAETVWTTSADGETSVPPPSASVEIEFTVIQNADGRSVMPTITWDSVSHRPVKQGGANIWNGLAFRVRMVGAAGIAHVMNTLKSHALIVTAPLLPKIPADEKIPVHVVTKAMLGANPGCVSRSPDFFHRPAGRPGVIFIDVDTKGLSPDVKIWVDYYGGVWGLLCEVFPSLVGVAHVERASTSAGLSYRGQRLPDSGNMHISILIEDASDAPRVFDVMVGRLGAQGLNSCRISETGSILGRGIVDPALKNIAQPVFEGPPLLDEGLTQEPRVAKAFEGTLWDTRALLPDLSADEIAEEKRITAYMHAALEPEAQLVREACITRHATRTAHANGRAAPDARDFVAARRLFAGGQTDLPASTPLLFDNRALGKDGVVTAREVMHAPEVYEGQTLADPPDWSRGGVAKVFRQRDGGLLIHSYLHGETNYWLRWEFADVMAAIEGARYSADSSVLDVYADMVTHAILDNCEKKALVDRVTEISGLARAAINKAEQQKKRERAQQRNPQNAAAGTAGTDPATCGWMPQPGLDSLIDKINQTYQMVGKGGGARIMSREHDDQLNMPVLKFETYETFAKLHGDLPWFIGPDGKEHPGVWCWINHPRSKRFKAVDFDPSPNSQPKPDRLNLWEGFAVEARQGNWSKNQAHLRDIMCSGVEEHYTYLEKVYAYWVQHPDEQGYVALIFQTEEEGTGKNFHVDSYQSLWGRHGMMITNRSQLTGRFNGHFRDLVMLTANEVTLGGGDSEATGAFLSMITDSMLSVEGKGEQPVTCKNYLHIVLLTNHSWAMPASRTSRRLFVPTVSAAKMQDFAHFAELQEELDNGGREAMMYYFLTLDLTGFNIRDIPQTEGLERLKKSTATPLQQWWVDVLYRGSLTAAGQPDGWASWVSTDVLYAQYLEFSSARRLGRAVSRHDFGEFMTLLSTRARANQERMDAEKAVADNVIIMPDVYKATGAVPPPAPDTRAVPPGVMAKKKKRPWGYAIGSLEAARAAYCEHYKVHYDWTEGQTQQPGVEGVEQQATGPGFAAPSSDAR